MSLVEIQIKRPMNITTHLNKRSWSLGGRGDVEHVIYRIQKLCSLLEGEDSLGDLMMIKEKVMIRSFNLIYSTVQSPS